jgi:vancomycin resistance protein YoaR
MKKKVQAPNLSKHSSGQEEKPKKWLNSLLVKWLIGGSVTLLVVAYIAYHLAYLNKIYPGVTIVGHPAGNLTITQATNKLQTLIPTLLLHRIEVESDGQQWELDLKKANLSYDTTATAKKAYQIGRTGKLINDLQAKIKTWVKGTNIGMEYSLDQNALESQIATIAAQIFIPAIKPTIKALESTPSGETSRILIEQGKDGRELDRRQLISLLTSHLSFLNFNPIDLPIIHISPKLTSEQIENTRQRAEEFLGKKLILLADEQTRWEFGENDLIELLSFTDGFDQDKIASWSANLALAINRPAENAAFQFSEGKVGEFRPAKEGKTLEQKKTVDLIAQSLAELKKGGNQLTVRLPITITPPAIKTADANTLGIKELIGKGISYFRGSIPSRTHNIQLASFKLNGVLIPPGEVFSFNQALGEVSQSTGYKEAHIIKEGRTILGDGGGVCQVSTTLFRAALNGGLPIEERHAHAYRLFYYEQDSPVGLDATVFAPTVDLKIKNDTPAHILIQTNVDLENKILTFELYGTYDGRLATISKSRVWDQTPPPPDLYQDDPTSPVGTIKQIERKVWGAKVAFDYRVERNGETLQNRTFYSNYRPWQAVYLRGTRQ